MANGDGFANLVRARLAEVKKRIEFAAKKVGRDRSQVTLIAVTKSLPLELIPLLNGLEITDFGENRPQELSRRQPLVPEKSWHMIGHLQRNKVVQTLAHASLIHSVDSLRLLEEIEKESAKKGTLARILFQINGSREPQKGGFEPDEIGTICDKIINLKATRVEGLMTMAAYSDDPETARPTFVLVRELLSQLNKALKGQNHPLDQLSMGMSGDYEVAIEEGATLVRIGSALFEGFAS